MESSRILRCPELLRITQLSKATIYRMVAKGTFPKQVRLAERAVGWRSEDVVRWLNSRPVAEQGRRQPARRGGRG